MVKKVQVFPIHSSAPSPVISGKVYEVTSKDQRPQTPSQCIRYAVYTQVDRHNAAKINSQLLHVLHVTMSSEDETFVFFLVRIPELRCLSVQWARTAHISKNHTQMTSKSHLFGSPNRLCKLSRTLCTLYTALHLSRRMSRQMRPEKSTFGW